MSDNDEAESSADYNIYPIKDDPEKAIYKPVGDKLLTPPFTALCCASRNTGKTVLVQNLVCRPYPFYGGVFDRIILISGTLKNDRSARYLVDYCGDENCFTEYDDRIIEGLYEANQGKAPEDQEKVLVIGDDIPSLGASQTAKLYTMATTNRHVNISTILISQLLRSTGKGGGIGSSYRNNCEMYIIGRQSNKKTLDSIMEELSHFQDPRANLLAYNDIVAGNPYSFMVYNNRNLSIRDNFNDEVFRRYDENGNYNPDYSGKKAIDEYLKDLIQS